MKNWINIWSIRSIISNVVNPKRRKVNFTLGKNADNDLKFLIRMRKGLGERHLNLLGVNKVSNNSLIAELNTLTQQIIKGTPSITKYLPCPDPVEQPNNTDNQNCNCDTSNTSNISCPACPMQNPNFIDPANCPVCPDCVCQGRQCPQCPVCKDKVIVDLSQCPSLDCQPVCQNYLRQYLSQFNQSVSLFCIQFLQILLRLKQLIFILAFLPQLEISNSVQCSLF